MLTRIGGNTKQIKSGKTKSTPCLKISRLGIVSRDYGHEYENGYRDFTDVMPSVLKVLDNEECDAVLFSLFSIVPRALYDPRAAFSGLENIKAIFIEEFNDVKSREAGRYVIYYRIPSGWKEYEFHQVFGTVTGMPQRDIEKFVADKMPKRILGKCCVLLCGETNGVKYSKADQKIHDTFGLRNAIPENVNVILNPIHDRMTRFEMKLKRQFLSQDNRWVVSVWNKGKMDKNGTVRDGNVPAWTVYYNGKEVSIDSIEHNFPKIEIGILNVAKA